MIYYMVVDHDGRRPAPPELYHCTRAVLERLKRYGHVDTVMIYQISELGVLSIQAQRLPDGSDILIFGSLVFLP